MVNPSEWEPWRVEADDEWLVSHSSKNFGRLRSTFKSFAGPADAVSHTPLSGMLGGAQRNPVLRVRDTIAEQIRYAETEYSYTAVVVTLDECRTCRSRLSETHHMLRVSATGVERETGSLSRCRRCDADSWLFTSRMPAVLRRERMSRKNVL